MIQSREGCEWQYSQIAEIPAGQRSAGISFEGNEFVDVFLGYKIPD
jgi:hypothetical protein